MRVMKITRKSTAEGYKDLEVGDTIFFIHDLKSTLGASNGVYATQIELNCPVKGISVKKSSNNTLRLISGLVLKEVFDK